MYHQVRDAHRSVSIGNKQGDELMICDDSDLLLSDDKCYFWKQNISMTKTTYSIGESPYRRKTNITVFTIL